MKIIEDRRAPNPRRVRIFLAEKGIEVPFENVDIMKEEHRAGQITALNHAQRIPILVLDNGETICESIAICRYFEALHPEPPLMGITPEEIAGIEMWQRRVELLLLQSIAHVLRHTNQAMSVLEKPQIAEWGEANRAKITWALEWFDRELGDKQYMAGNAFSVADITTLVAVDFMRVIKMNLDPYSHFRRWYDLVSARPSANA